MTIIDWQPLLSETHPWCRCLQHEARSMPVNQSSSGAWLNVVSKTLWGAHTSLMIEMTTMMNGTWCTSMQKKNQEKTQRLMIVKSSPLEDARNRMWHSVVDFGKWLTVDESQIAGWCHSPITQDPEQKPIWMSATLHSLCDTKGHLSAHKLFAPVCGDKRKFDLNKQHPDTASVSKHVSLQSIVIQSFTGRGCCLVMDIIHMGDIVALIARQVWQFNMVGTCQSNRTGAGWMAKCNLTSGTTEKRLWQK